MTLAPAADARTVTKHRLDRVGSRVLTVLRTEDVTPRYRRIVLGGPELEADFPWAAFAPTSHVKVLVPGADGGVVLPEPDGPRPALRDYTVRGWDPEARELTLDFVLHGHGLAGTWAAAAKPGDRLGVLGPRGLKLFPTGYPFYLVAGDASALPAVSRFVEELPAGARALAFVEVEDAAEEQRLAVSDDVEVRWVHRASGERLADAVRAWAPPSDHDWFAFAAGEAGSMREIRTHLRREVGLPREQVVVDGYWKQGEAGADHHAFDLGDD